MPVLYVAGNHEHYDERIGRLHEILREAAADSNVHIFENETFELNGYRFFGATLRTDFNLFGDRRPSLRRDGGSLDPMVACIHRWNTERLNKLACLKIVQCSGTMVLS